MTVADEQIRVLHVDDEPDFGDMVATFLEEADDRLSVLTATSAAEGLEHLSGTPIDCVVSDLDMPGQTGIEFLEAVRSDDPNLPFILYTGKGSEDVASNAISAGVTDYLQKEHGTDHYAVLANSVTNAVASARAERRAEKTRTELEAIVTNTTDAILIIDEASTIRFANPAVESLFGYAPDALEGKSLTMLMPQRYRSDHQAAIARYLSTGERTVDWKSNEFECQHRDGQEIPVSVAFSEFQQDGERRFIGVVRDVTDRKAHERELELVGDLLHQTERIADVGGWEIDTETEAVFWTEHLFELLGVEGEEEPPLETALDVYHEDDRHVVEAAVGEALEAGEPFDVEVRFRRPVASTETDGDDVDTGSEVRWLRVQGTPTVVDGEVVSLRGAAQDVTDRRDRERVLREVHDVIADREQSFAEQVQALLELGRRELGTEYGTLSAIRDDEYVFEVVAGGDDDVQAGNVVPVAATNCEIVAATEETLVIGDVARDAPEETDRAGYSEWGIACYVGAPVFVDDDVYGTFCFYDRRPREDHFSDWEETLVDLMSRWVSAELQRRQSNERLKRSNDQLEQFASIVSHDLRNPLNVAAGAIELAADSGDIEELSRARTAMGRMETLIDELLTVAQSGGEGDREPIALRALIEGCWRTVVTGDATLVVDVDRTVRAEESRLKQLFENLFRNAIEHGGDGITVTVGELPVGFFIEDDGDGIPSGDRETAFESGYSTSEAGTGFGLSIARQVATVHDWDIQVTEGTAGGARFEVSGVTFLE
jgi:PAS domain S-box-containing protein